MEQMDTAMTAISHVIHELEELADRPQHNEWSVFIRTDELLTLADQLVSAHRIILNHQVRGKVA